MADNKFSREPAPPPPLFFGEKERNLVKQINDEVIERFLGQTIVYYPIDIERTNYHDIYGEAIEKTFLSPIRVYALVLWEGTEEIAKDGYVDKEANISVYFHKRRLNEDQNLVVRVGDFVLFGTRYYEIVSLKEPKNLFGQVGYSFEITAKCIRARRGIFDGNWTIIWEME